MSKLSGSLISLVIFGVLSVALIIFALMKINLVVIYAVVFLILFVALFGILPHVFESEK